MWHAMAGGWGSCNGKLLHRRDQRLLLARHVHTDLAWNFRAGVGVGVFYEALLCTDVTAAMTARGSAGRVALQVNIWRTLRAA